MIIGRKLRRFLPLDVRRATPEHILDVGAYIQLPAGYVPANPTILRVASGFLLCVRGLNYSLSEMGQIVTATPGQRLHSCNRFLLLDSDLRPVRTFPKLDVAFDGMEDVRLFDWDGRMMAIASRLLPDAGEYPSRMALFEIGADHDVAEQHDLASPFGLPREKNWCPFVSQGTLHFVYSFEPKVFLRYDPAGRCVVPADAASAAVQLGALAFLVAGSSAGMATPAGGLVFAAYRRHVSFPQMTRRYASRIYGLDARTGNLRPGPWFCIGQPGVQFINGMLVHGDRLILSFGERDCSARLALFPLQDFATVFFPTIDAGGSFATT